MRIALGIVAVLAVLAYLALVWFLAIRRERNARREAEAHGFSFPDPPYRYAGTFCTHCGQQLAQNELHHLRGAWTCPPQPIRPPVSFRKPAAKGFNRGEVA